MKNNQKYLVMHCSDISRTVLFDQLNSTNNYHKERGFPLSSLNYYVGYHYLYTNDKEYQCRKDDEEGAHCNQGYDGKTVYAPGTYDHDKITSMNFQSIGLCLGIDGDIEYPSSMQYALLQKRVWALQDKYNIPDENVFFHRFFTGSLKTCPGVLLDKEWLATLLIRPVETSIPPKPVEVRCVAEEAQIKALKEQLSWYDKLLSWFFSHLS